MLKRVRRLLNMIALLIKIGSIMNFIKLGMNKLSLLLIELKTNSDNSSFATMTTHRECKLIIDIKYELLEVESSEVKRKFPIN
jgi:hypothetical protein